MRVTATHWRWWAAALLVAFFVFEIPAIRDGVDGNTLSEYVWNLAPIWRAVILVGLTWLVVHFARAR